MTLNEQFRQLRKERGLTLAVVSDQTNISISFLSDFERGKSSISIPRLQKLLGVYDAHAAIDHTAIVVVRQPQIRH